MAIEQITIPIPEGYELESKTKRIPKVGEYYLLFTDTGDCVVERCTANNWSHEYYIVHRKWQPPASCPKGAVFVKIGTRWYLHSSDRITDTVWVYIEEIYTDFTPPPTSPYTVE